MNSLLSRGKDHLWYSVATAIGASAWQYLSMEVVRWLRVIPSVDAIYRISTNRRCGVIYFVVQIGVAFIQGLCLLFWAV